MKQDNKRKIVSVSFVAIILLCLVIGAVINNKNLAKADITVIEKIEGKEELKVSGFVASDGNYYIADNAGIYSTHIENGTTTCVRETDLRNSTYVEMREMDFYKDQKVYVMVAEFFDTEREKRNKSDIYTEIRIYDTAWNRIKILELPIITTSIEWGRESLIISGIEEKLSKNYFVDIMVMEAQETEAFAQKKSLQMWISDITNDVTEQWLYLPEIREYVLVHSDNSVECLEETVLRLGGSMIEEEITMFDTAKTYEYRLMRNPIDDYFFEKLNSASSYAEIRDYEYFYLAVWQHEYEKIMTMMQERCVMEEDKERLQIFMEEVHESFEKMKPFIETEILNNFEYPESLVKYSYGNSTMAKLMLYEGMNYRNACMLFTNSMYLTSYQFPTEEEINLLIEEQKASLE